jgi:hypothetical protein
MGEQGNIPRRRWELIDFAWDAGMLRWLLPGTRDEDLFNLHSFFVIRARIIAGLWAIGVSTRRFPWFGDTVATFLTLHKPNSHCNLVDSGTWNSTLTRACSLRNNLDLDISILDPLGIQHLGFKPGQDLCRNVAMIGHQAPKPRHRGVEYKPHPAGLQCPQRIMRP